MMANYNEFSLDDYMRRIGLSPAQPRKADLATLTVIMAAQSESIAFENIDVVLGRTISMSESNVVNKLVNSKRGGYCFEQNTLLAMALEHIGFKNIVPLACRVRWGKDSDEDGPNTTYTHLALKVVLDDGSAYLSDVGFAGINSIAPIRLDMKKNGEEQNMPEGCFRIVDGTSPLPNYSMLQLRVKGEWRSVYAWRDVHAPMVDLECYNWFSCTYPTARFTTSFFVCRVVGKNERHHILNGEYVVRKGLGIDKEQTSTVIADRKELLDLLEKVFNIHLGINDMEGHMGRIDRYLPSVKAESAPSSVKRTNMIQETKSFGRNSGDGDGIIEIIVVVDFMCPWTYIGLRCLELAMQKRVTNDDVRLELVPYEFDNLGTYPSVGIGWVDYCNSFGPTKARYLLDDKLPRAFATAESVGIGLRLERRIVHTHNINFALIKAQQGDGQVALAFALRALRDHFEGLHDPNTPELINKQLLEAGVSTEVTAEVIATIRRGCCADDHSTMALLLLAQKRAQDLGAPPVPLFVVRYDGIIVESDAIGPVTPEYFDSIFQRCLPIR